MRRTNLLTMVVVLLGGIAIGAPVCTGGTAPVASPARLALAPDGRLAVAEGASVALLRLPEAAR